MNRFIASCNLRCLIALLMAMGFAGATAAQEKFPVRPIELIVPWGPGGGADQLARLVSKLMEPMRRAGRSGRERRRRHRRDRHGEAFVGAGRRLFDGDLHRRQSRAACRQGCALEDERHRSGRRADPGAFIHLRGAGQPIQDLVRFREGSPRQSRQAQDRDARFRQRRRFLAEDDRGERHQVRAGAVFQAERTLRLDPRRACRRAL